MNRRALAVTVHDPEERLLSRLDPGLPELSTLYSRLCAACSGATSRRSLSALESAGFDVRVSGSAGVGESRRIAVSGVISDPSVAWVHYADFDRLLHWQSTFPAELRDVLAYRPQADYVALGRTPRALQTHPPVQILVETLTNEAFSALVGLESPADLVAGSCLISRRGAELLMQLSVENTNATDLEWPALILRETGTMPEFRAVEGLEFETADYYLPEIEEAGSRSAWISDAYNRPEVWVTRTQLALDSMAALGRVLGLQKRPARR